MIVRIQGRSFLQRLIGDKVVKAKLYKERADVTPVDVFGPDGISINQAVLSSGYGRAVGVVGRFARANGDCAFDLYAYTDTA